jgi:alanine racemase
LSFAPPLRLKLDGEALVANWRAMAKASGNAATGAAVKADAYGLGAREVVPRLWNAGCRDFFVAHWGEAEAIADLVPRGSIAVLNGLDANDLAEVIRLGAIPVLNTPNQIARWKAAGGGRCHVMLDSGINRLGIGPEQLGDGLFDGLEIDLLMSHLASADEDVSQNAGQLRQFVEMAQGIRARRRSLANSAGVMLGSDYHFDLTRPGLALYGGIARPELSDAIQQVAYPLAHVLQIRMLPAGTMVGYNAMHRCIGETPVATLSIGYADGYLRGFSGKGLAHHKGYQMPVIGRVSMDLVTIDATKCPDLAEGDWVEMEYRLDIASPISGLSQYELLTILGDRSLRSWR